MNGERMSEESTPKQGFLALSDYDLDRVEAEKRIENLILEQDKLQLERVSLRRLVSWHGTLLEWLKAATVPAALLGVLVTFLIGTGQVRQAEEGRAADRFDKALTRLASKHPGERITGISGLRLFLLEPDHLSSHATTMHFLIDALSLETDPLVQSAILDVFAGLDVKAQSASSLNAALATAVERNRSITAEIIDDSVAKVEEDRRKRVAQSLKLKPEEISSPIAQQFLDQMKFNDYLDLLSVSDWPFDHVEPDKMNRLRGLVKAISALIHLGGKTLDFTSIFCENCDFTPAQSLTGANFEGAFLSGADFSHLKLNNASFRNADLRGATFFAADLSGAHLNGGFNRLVDRSEARHSPPFPYLDCSHLRGADLSGIVLAQVRLDEKSNGHIVIDITAPNILSAEIDNTTKLDEFQISNVKIFSDEFIASLDTNKLGELEKEIRGNELPVRNLLPNILVNHTWTTVWNYFQNNSIPSAFAAGQFISPRRETGYTQMTDFNASSDYSMIKSWARDPLLQTLDQPGWQTTKLLKDFADSLIKGLSPNAKGRPSWDLSPHNSCSEAKPSQQLQVSSRSEISSESVNQGSPPAKSD
jgi:hypothetical protein